MPAIATPTGASSALAMTKRLLEFDEYVQDALDLIEFANGDASTVWGGVRAKMGHAEPFGMEYLGIGNEEVGEAFFEKLQSDDPLDFWHCMCDYDAELFFAVPCISDQ